MDITSEVIAVLKLVRGSQVYRTREGGSLDYVKNRIIVKQCIAEGLIGGFGRCRTDYFLTPAGELALTNWKED